MRDPLSFPVHGHALQAEGAPHTGASCQEWPCDTIAGVERVNQHGRRSATGVGGHGHALCECGWQSKHLLTGAARRRAHVEHKDTVRPS